MRGAWRSLTWLVALWWARRGACGLSACTREAWWGEAKHCFIGSVGGGEVSPGVPGGGLRERCGGR